MAKNEEKFFELSRILARIVDRLHDYFDKLIQDNDYYDAETISDCIHDLTLIQKIHDKKLGN